MATAARQVCRQARQHLSSHRTQWLSLRQTATATKRCLSTSPMTRNAEDKQTESGGDGEDGNAPHFNSHFWRRLNRADRLKYQTSSPEVRKDMERVGKIMREELGPGSRTHREMDESIRNALHEIEESFPDPLEEREYRSDGFFNMGEKEDIGPDDDFKGDDISSTAHGELEQTREIREYARNAAWEMPLLAHLAKAFEKPTAATPLRFRYTTYLGEQHPAARKVVVEFDPKDLSLSGPQVDKLIKLLGPRYNPDTGIAKMSAEEFETQAQNKRYLGDTIKSLITEAKDPKETFADLPFDFRHHKPKPKLQFPDEWLLTVERKKELEDKRAARAALEAKQAETVAGLIDGIQAIEFSRNINAAKVEAPVMASVKAPLPSGKMGKKEMGQKAARR
ncbi:hypothetical protein AAFC00_000846 [Neodothiora populina]|uniref:Small ribosomal subunit protein mS35 mitochondrial conserved domain-containing protein n=1 Tax=Neodothiora populina TaxID=2781224 RepID=A0ABR3PMB6_9PEZI